MEKIKQWVRKYVIWVLLALSVIFNLYISANKWLERDRAKYKNLGANQVIQNIVSQSQGQEVTINLGGKLFILTPQKMGEEDNDA